MWKAPNRPTHEVTQSYNDGVVTVWRLEDVAKPGYQPVKKLVPKEKLLYEERALGLSRYYAGRQNQVEIQRVIRVQYRPGVSSQDVAVTQDGRQYRIDLVQRVQDVFPPSMDLTLAKVEQRYEVIP